MKSHAGRDAWENTTIYWPEQWMNDVNTVKNYIAFATSLFPTFSSLLHFYIIKN